MVRLLPSGAIKEERESTSVDMKEKDDVSYQRHIKALQQEYKKGKPNPNVVAELMVATYNKRHKEILDQPVPVSSILLKFPFLQSYEEVHVLIHVQLYNYRITL